MYKQICNSSFPLHPLMPLLIESYVNSVIPKTSKPEHTNEPLSESKIMALFDIKKKTLPEPGGSSVSPGYPDIQEKLLCPQLLILYYLLLYEDLYQTHKKLIGKLCFFNTIYLYLLIYPLYTILISANSKTP